MSKKNIEDCIDDVFSAIDFDDLVIWANALNVEVDYPPVGDLWPDWEAELSVEVGAALLKAIEFNIHTDVCPKCNLNQPLG